MKIIATSDWHLGNMFHGNDRLKEHRHFLHWLLQQLEEQQPDALLVAGDVFDNGNPSSASQSAYYEFLAQVGERLPGMPIIITAGNHDSASRLEAPRELLRRHNVEVRGIVKRNYNTAEGKWVTNFDDLMIPVRGKDGDEVIVLAVPYLRTDVVQSASYSAGVNDFIRTLTAKARERFPEHRLVMMAHMYAKGADIATKDASEKIVIGGQEEVNMEGWEDHPDYLTCGHIHKRQHIWNTDWARYSGSVLPMSFAEKDYTHGVDLITMDKAGRPKVKQLVYTPQHRLVVLPEDETPLTPAKIRKLIETELPDLPEEGKDENAVYVVLKVKVEKFNGEQLKELGDWVNTKNAILCKTQRIVEDFDVTTITGGERLTSIDDILHRDPMLTLRECFAVKHEVELSEQQEALLRDMLMGLKEENED